MPRGQNKSTSKPKKEAAPETKTAQPANTAEPAEKDAGKKGGKGKKGKGKWMFWIKWQFITYEGVEALHTHTLEDNRVGEADNTEVDTQKSEVHFVAVAVGASAKIARQ